MSGVSGRRRSRSSSPKPSLRPRRDYVTASPSPSPNITHPLSSRYPSGAVNTASLSVPVAAVDPQRSANQPLAEGNSGNLTCQTPEASQPFLPIGTGGSNPARTTPDHHFLPGHTADPLPLPDSQDPIQSQQFLGKNPGMFNQARDFTVARGTFIDRSVTYYNVSTNQFMKELLEVTIRGAEFDSSDRDPPPRCHPGTRLAILERCIYFIFNCNGVNKMLWVVGAAGIGKSAIMQSVAESPEFAVSPHASVFFSINGRDDATKTILTLSYQLAVMSASYHQVIAQEIAHDPSLLRSSMAKQFNKFIIEPFIHRARSQYPGRVVIIIDGLDECKDHRSQQELLRLISDLCITYPSSPLVWLISSRPEPHITSFFSRPNIISAFEKEEIPMDSCEARADVERFLRGELTKIKEESDSLDPLWPDEQDVLKLTGAAGGLFAYAHTVVRYIGDSRIGSPVLQLSDVLHVIDKHPLSDVSREEHPMALLDALYNRILSKVPAKAMTHTRKILLALASDWSSTSEYNLDGNFITLCNWLDMTPDEAYAAVNHLRSILYVPRRDEAHNAELKVFHKSFVDYISDFSRSEFSHDILEEARQLNAHCAFRILNEASCVTRSSDSVYKIQCGLLVSDPVARGGISLSWSAGQAGGWSDDDMRSNLHRLATGSIVSGMKQKSSTFQSVFCIRTLATIFDIYFPTFPFYELLGVVFDESRRTELTNHGILKHMPLEAIDVSELLQDVDVKLRFRRSRTAVTNLSDPWESSCQHEREGKWEVREGRDLTTTSKDKVDDWTTTFRGWATTSPCTFCFKRLQRQLEKGKVHAPDDTTLVMFTSTGDCCAQVRLVDPEDGVSEWIYSFWLHIPKEKRKKYGSTV